jgi:hypothetical protein
MGLKPSIYDMSFVVEWPRRGRARITYIVTLDLFPNLFQSVLNYLLGEPVSYNIAFSISTSFLGLHLPIYQKRSSGVW